MSTHKSKLFKQMFEKHADQFSSEVNEDRKVMSVMTEQTFVPLMGQMWAKTKARYKKRYRQKALIFTMWVVENYTSDIGLESDHTISELFEIWKKEN